MNIALKQCSFIENENLKYSADGGGSKDGENARKSSI
jgi:hypothetical protein